MRKKVLLGLLGAALFACGYIGGVQEVSEEQLNDWFHSHRRGSSGDVALYQMSALRGEWDHVLTVHGMANDAEFCEELKKALDAPYPLASFSCRALNISADDK